MRPIDQNTLYRTAAISFLGLVIGLTTAFATIGFVELVQYLNSVLYITTSSREALDSTSLTLITIAVLTLGGLIVGLVMQFGVQQKESLGPADTIYAVQLHERLPAPLSGVASTAAAILSLGCGASVGQYGPLVYLGTLIAQLFSRLKLGLADVRTIGIACGVAAAISTAFNAPIAGLIFTHEVVLRHYSLRMFTAVTIASACGYLVANVIFHHPPLFLIDFEGSFRSGEFFLFALEGIACGLLAVAFMKLLAKTTRLSQRIPLPLACKPMMAGFAVSLIALQIPEILGAGQEVFGHALIAKDYAADTLLLILVAKMAVTVICIGFGFAGGIIFPALLIGVLFGSLFATLIPEVFLEDYSGLAVYAICGMVALMSPVIGAPITAVLLVFEFTRSYEITIAAMIVIVFSNLIAHRWCGRSLYDSQLAVRGIDLSLGRERAYLMHQRVVSLVTTAIPVASVDSKISQAATAMLEGDSVCIVVVNTEKEFLGLLFQHQLQQLDENDPLSSIQFEEVTTFDQNTSIWEAMEIMRYYIGEAIPVVDSDNGHYLGAIPESVVINAYLDAATELRREEYEV